MFDIFFFFENRAVFEIMWKNMAELDRPQMTIKYSACALRATKATDNTLEVCITYFFSSKTTVTRTRLNVTFMRTLPLLITT